MVAREHLPTRNGLDRLIASSVLDLLDPLVFFRDVVRMDSTIESRVFSVMPTPDEEYLG